MKSLIITTERVNSKGFRVMSDGGEVADYLRNPVLLYDHVRRTSENNKDIILPIGRLNNLRREGTSWIGDPEFDLNDSFARSVANKYEKGYLNAASVGIEIIETSNDPSLLQPGQTLPSVTKWRLKEVSITDIPANADAVKLNYRGKSIVCLNGTPIKEDLTAFFGHVKHSSTDDLTHRGLSAEWDKRWRDGSLEEIKRTNLAYYEQLFQAKFKGKVDSELKLTHSSLGYSTHSNLSAEWDKCWRDGSLEEIKRTNLAYYEQLFQAKFRSRK